MTVLNVGQLQGIFPTNEITVAQDTLLDIQGILRVATIQNSSGLTVLTSNPAGDITLSGNLTTTNTITAPTIAPSSQFRIPTWSTGNRPSSPAVALIGYNTSSLNVEMWTGSSWTPVGLGSPNSTKDTLNVFSDGSCLALWKFDGNANDTSGNYNGSPSNLSYTSTDVKFGQAGIFNGTNTTVSIPNVKNSYPFAVSLWATHNTGWVQPSDGMDELFNASINGQRVSMGIVRNPGWTTGPTLMYGGTSHWSCSNSYLANDSINYYHIVYNVAGNNDASHSIYINGIWQQMVNNGGAHGGTPGWNIGSNSSGAEYWRGKIDQVRFFNRTISQSEVLTLFAET